MKEEAKSGSKRITLADIFACIANFLSLMINGIAMLPVFIEQIQTGWGFGTRYEMMVLLFWMIHLCTAPLVLFGLVNCIWNVVKRNTHWLFALNASLLAAALTSVALSVLFAFN